MSARQKRSTTDTMLELWRPPRGAGEAVGCLTSTYTFEPSLFDEQCLARFLEIECDPNREDIAFLLERETRLGAAYAGVLVDHTQAGVDHSLRWDVLPVRIHGGKQHAKLSLLAWTHHVRLIVASANLTESGYRFNREVAIALDSTLQRANVQQIMTAIEFLRCLLAFVPAAVPEVPEVQRARRFLGKIERQLADWAPAPPTETIQQHLLFTLPHHGGKPTTGEGGFPARSSLDEAIAQCRRYGRSPTEAWIASPFFDAKNNTDAATAALCKSMARGTTRRLTVCLPALGTADERPLRLAAPRSLKHTPARYSTLGHFEVLPQKDGDGNHRPWHAKMLKLTADAYSALLTGSSNFTQAGLGLQTHRNAEANVLSIVRRRQYAREPGHLEAIWPDTTKVADPDQAEWLGPESSLDEEQWATAICLPAGFLSASYRAGAKQRSVILYLAPEHLPSSWSVFACGGDGEELLNQDTWAERGRSEAVILPWPSVQPPEILLVRWPAGKASWAINVEDMRQLPPPRELEGMSADDMLLILAASDPSAAFRAWTKQRQSQDTFEDELDTAIPTDLDPLQRHDLRTTFLRRIRTRARALFRLRENLQRPVWSLQALQWRLEGFIGIKPLAERLLNDVATADGQVDEALLTLADFLIVLHEVEYESAEGAVPKAEYDRTYRSFLRGLIDELDKGVQECRGRIGKNIMVFWQRVVERCRT